MISWEIYLYLLVIGVVSLPLIFRARRLGGRAWIPVLSVFGLGVSGAIFWSPLESDRQRLEEVLPKQVVGDEFVSSQTCRSCHPGHYASWHDSFHRSMTQIASPETVLAPFDGVQLTSRGRTYRLLRVGDEYGVEMADPDYEGLLKERGADMSEISAPPRTTRRIVMTTGSHHYQGYWVPSTRGRELRQLPWIYHLAEQRWIPAEDAFLRPPDAGRRFAIWNNNCINCHSVGAVPGINPATGGLNSQVAELGISCEACHGPGGEHIRKHRNPVRRYWQHLSKEPDPTIVNPADCSHRVASQICGQCHSSFAPLDLDDWLENGFRYRAGDDLDKSYKQNHFDDSHAKEFHDDAYWGDGTNRVGGREYLAMIESACYQDGKLSCLSCHSMHDSDPDDQLGAGMDGNRACLQCHTDYGDRVEAHTHHSPRSAGSQCYNCHMPHTSYALFKGIRSHRIDVPSVNTSAHTGRPNACNLCHTDKTLQWTATHLSQWYGISTDALNDDQQTISAALLWLLRGDAVQRAIAAWSLGWGPALEAAGRDWQAPMLAQLLQDPYSAVRFIAYRSLRQLSNLHDVGYDFVGSEQQRLEAQQQVLRTWQRRGHSARGEDSPQVLLDPDGTLRQQELDRLLGERDDRPLELPE